VICLLVSG
jgi:hypothetical protein